MLLSNPAIKPGAYLGSITASTPEGDRYVHRSADVHMVREVGNKRGYAAINDALDAVQRLGSNGQTLAVLGDYLSGDKLHIVETKAMAKLVGQQPRVDRSILRLEDLGSDGLTKITSDGIGDVVLVHGQTAWDNVSGYDLLTSLENMYEV